MTGGNDKVNYFASGRFFTQDTNQDLGRSRVIFLAFARDQQLIVFILITGSIMVYGLGSREDALSMRREKELRINVWIPESSV